MDFLKNFINFLSDPKILIVLTSVLLFVSLRYPRKFYTNRSAMFVFAGMGLFLVLSMFNEEFYNIVTNPDNVPIEGWPVNYPRNAKLKGTTLDDVQRDKLNHTNGQIEGVLAVRVVSAT